MPRGIKRLKFRVNASNYVVDEYRKEDIMIQIQ